MSGGQATVNSADALKRRQRLERMLNPRSIVFVGGGALEPAIAYTRKCGFKGRYRVINPTRQSLSDIPCLRSASEMDEPCDLAFVAVPGPAAIAAVEDLAAAGVGAAVVNSAGFAETGPDGRVLQQQLLSAAGDMPIIGPNCPGFANFLDGVAAMLDDLGGSGIPGGVAIISNGGAYLADITNSDRSLPIAFIAGLGNQASVSVPEMMDVVLDDERISVVNLYFESIRDVPALSRSALKARRRGVPVVVLKVGRTKAGARAAMSHTASLSGDAEVASALFRRLGFIEVQSASEAMEVMKLLHVCGAPDDNRIALATSSGTYAVTGADAAERSGLELPELAADQVEKLQPLIESFLNAGNPLDIATAQFWPDQRQREIFDAFLEGPFDLAVQTMSFPAPDTWDDESWYRSAQVFSAAARARGLKCAFVSPTHEGLPAKAREHLIEHGTAPLQGFADGMQAIALSVEWKKRQSDLYEDAMSLPACEVESDEWISLDEHQAKNRLDAAGISTPRRWIWQVSQPPPVDIGYPVVLKVLDENIVHKSEIGGVVTGLGAADSLLSAGEEMLAQLKQNNLLPERLLIESQVQGVTGELMVGLRRMDGFGVMLTLAVGGIAVELMRDVVNLFLPAPRAEIERTLRSLKMFPLLDGWRGRETGDLAAALDAIESMADLMLDNTEILELEVNPLLVCTSGAVAVDAVMKINRGKTHDL